MEYCVAMKNPLRRKCTQHNVNGKRENKEQFYIKYDIDYIKVQKD